MPSHTFSFSLNGPLFLSHKLGLSVSFLGLDFLPSFWPSVCTQDFWKWRRFGFHVMGRPWDNREMWVSTTISHFLRKILSFGWFLELNWGWFSDYCCRFERYVYDYLMKNGRGEIAEIFRQEANLSFDPMSPPGNRSIYSCVFCLIHMLYLPLW